MILEDHSAKTFIRPQWQALMQRLKASKRSNINHILFTKWDRFSRNAGDAYQMINHLRRHAIDPQAIEQPLDLRVPENKMMLAFYLAAPEVENDRRALNVFHGMRRAKKEGRWVATAPMGYRNTTAPDGRKTITPDDRKAPIIRWIFHELATGRFNTEQVWKMAVQKGLKCSKNNFWLAIRNPVYCGKIFVPAFENEQAHCVPGLHEPLITSAIFDSVQDVLSGRKRNPFNKPKIVSKETLPLRGFLICPNYNRLLSGSASKGKKYYYHYYHCKAPCGVRFKAEEVNQKFLSQLSRLVPRPGRMKIYSELIMARFREEAKTRDQDRRDSLQALEKLNDRMQNARIKMVDGLLSPEDFQMVKESCSKQISDLEKKLNNLSSDHGEISSLLKKTLARLEHLINIYKSGSLEEKRQLVGSIFPENLIFDGNTVRTPRINEGIDLIYQISNKLQSKKKRDKSIQFGLVP